MTIPTRDEMRREAYLRLISAILGDRDTCTLAEVYGVLREYPRWAGMKDRALRALLVERGVPLRAQVRTEERAGVAGVHIEDIEAAMTGVPIPDPPPTSTPEVYAYVPGQRGVEVGVEGVAVWGERHAAVGLEPVWPGTAPACHPATRG